MEWSEFAGLTWLGTVLGAIGMLAGIHVLSILWLVLVFLLGWTYGKPILARWIELANLADPDPEQRRWDHRFDR